MVDEQSRPLADTRVILITSSYPYGRERWRDEQRSGEDGVASFENHSEWRAESLMIHGRTIFFWNWCVEKPGYATYRTLLTSSDDFDARPTITLTPGSSQTATIRARARPSAQVLKSAEMRVTIDTSISAPRR